MSWLTPLIGTLALVALPTIVVLHLLRVQRRRLRVPALDLWRDPSPTLERSPRRLPVTLPLILRLLVATLLAVALAQPLLRGLSAPPTTTALLLDTSGSMAARDEAPSRWIAAQAEARSLIGSLRPGDELALIDMADPPRLLERGGPERSGALTSALQSIAPGGSNGSLQSAMDLARAALEPSRAARVVVLTDAALTSASPISTPAPVEWRTFGDQSGNVAFGAFATRPTPSGTQLYARVVNLGDAPVARTLTLQLDGEVAATEMVRLEGGGTAEWSWPLPPAAQQAEARLDGSDALPEDDRQIALLRSNAPLRVLLVSSTPSSLERALRALPNVDVVTAQPTNYATAATDLVIFNGFVPAQMPPAPTWFVAPPNSSLLPVTARRDNLAADSVLDQRFGALDLRPVRFGNVALIQVPSWASVALAAGEVPLILSGVHGGQPVVVWTWDPDKGNFANRLQFPLLLRTTLRTIYPTTVRSFTPGDLAPQALVAPDGTGVATGTALPTVGVYKTADGQPSLVVNLLDESESDLSARPRPEIRQAVAAGGTEAAPGGRRLWPILILIVCAGLFGEALFAQRRRSRVIQHA